MHVSTQSPSFTFKEIDHTELNRGPLLAKGPFADIYEGTWTHQVGGNEVCDKVAIKAFHLKCLPSNLASEFDIYHKVNHSNIVPFHGVCSQPGAFCMVTPSYSTNLRKFYESDEFSTISRFDLNNIYKQISIALSYLHNMEIACKFLKSNNIFVEKGKDIFSKNVYKILLGDFGLSNLKIQSAKPLEGHAIFRWRAPETFTREYSRIKNPLAAQKAADVYSYGCILNEVESRKMPFANLSEADVIGVLSCNITPEIAKTHSIIQTIIQDCFSIRSQRPTPTEIIKLLQDLEEFELNLPLVFQYAGLFSQNGMRDVLPIIQKYLYNLALKEFARK